MKSLPNARALKRSHDVYMNWLWDYWAYTRWATASHRMVFWYGVAGASFAGGEALADDYLSLANSMKLSRMPAAKRKLWHTARRLATDIRRSTGMALIPWLVQARADLAWDRLQDVHLVGPKIASWIMRDVSLLADFSVNDGPSTLSYLGDRNPAWFHSLEPATQRYFIPIDRWVFRKSRSFGAISKSLARHGFSGLQINRRLYLKAAEQLATFADKAGVDIRDLDVYWYQLGADWIDEDGYELE